MNFLDVNFLSIAVAAAVAWIASGLYYSVLCGPRFVALGTTREQAKAEQAGKSIFAKAVPFVLAYVGEFIMGWVLYGLLFHFRTFTLRTGIISAAFCWFGFVLTTITINNAFSNRRLLLTVIDSIGWLIPLLLIGAIVGAWGP